jgi:methionyl-tRNA formyltransferase
VPQPAEGVTYAAKIDKAEARVDWTRPAVEVDRLIRGLSPAPGAWCLVGEERVKLLGARLAAGEAQPGQVLKGFTVACGTGAVEVTEVQREGKRPMPAGRGAARIDPARPLVRWVSTRRPARKVGFNPPPLRTTRAARG